MPGTGCPLRSLVLGRRVRLHLAAHRLRLFCLFFTSKNFTFNLQEQVHEVFRFVRIVPEAGFPATNSNRGLLG